MPQIDSEGLGEGERKNLAQEKLGWENDEAEADEPVMDTREEIVWNNEDVDMESADEALRVEPANADKANRQASAALSNPNSQTYPAAIDDSFGSLFEGDDSTNYLLEGDVDNNVTDTANFHISHELTSPASIDFEKKPEINEERSEESQCDWAAVDMSRKHPRKNHVIAIFSQKTPSQARKWIDGKFSKQAIKRCLRLKRNQCNDSSRVLYYI